MRLDAEPIEGSCKDVTGAEINDRQRGDRQRGDRQRGDRQRGDRQRGDRQRGVCRSIPLRSTRDPFLRISRIFTPKLNYFVHSGPEK